MRPDLTPEDEKNEEKERKVSRCGCAWWRWVFMFVCLVYLADRWLRILDRTALLWKVTGGGGGGRGLREGRVVARLGILPRWKRQLICAPLRGSPLGTSVYYPLPLISYPILLLLLLPVDASDRVSFPSGFLMPEQFVWVLPWGGHVLVRGNDSQAMRLPVSVFMYFHLCPLDKIRKYRKPSLCSILRGPCLLLPLIPLSLFVDVLFFFLRLEEIAYISLKPFGSFQMWRNFWTNRKVTWHTCRFSFFFLQTPMPCASRIHCLCQFHCRRRLWPQTLVLTTAGLTYARRRTTRSSKYNPPCVSPSGTTWPPRFD